MTEDEIGHIVVDTCIHIHKDLGPGLFESVYQAILAHELRERGLEVQREVRIPLEYDGVKFDVAFIADMIINNKVILELKSTEHVSKVHHKQLTTYLKITGMKLGFVLNFGQALMKHGIDRVVNGLEESPNRTYKAPRKKNTRY